MIQIFKRILKKVLVREFVFYVFVGLLTTLISIVVYKLLLDAGFNIVFSNTVSTIVAVSFAFVANKILVFRSLSFYIKILLKEFLIFLSSRVVTYIIDTLLLIFLVTVLFYDPVISKVFTSILVIFLNYIASKNIVFKKK